MKKIILTIITLAVATIAMAQSKQPDAEYNLIRRSYKVNSDSTMELRFHKEIVLLRNRAITAYADKGETFITYNPAFETLTINECYTIRPDGTKVNTPQNAFVLQLPSECANCGRLNDLREMAIVHTALEYNCTIVLDYTLKRRASFLAERFNLNQDKPTYTAEQSLPEAATLLSSLKCSDSKEYAAAIRNWVVDYVTLNPVDLARVNYAMTPAAEVFNSNCGTLLDKTGLLAAMLNQAGFRATIVDNSLNVFGDRPLEVEVSINGNNYRLNASSKTPLLTESEKADAANVASAPVYIDRALEWKPDTIVDNYVRITLPVEQQGIRIDPAKLTPHRQSDVQTSATSEFYHYTLPLPKGAKLIGGEVNIEYTNNVGSINIIVKQKKNRLLITRSLRLRKALINKTDYPAFRQLMSDWNSHRELFFSL